MVKAFAALGVLAFVVLLVGGLMIYPAFHGSLTRDSVMVLAQSASSRFEKDPPPTLAELEAIALQYDRAGVTWAKPGPDGRPRDEFGTLFRFRHRPAPPAAVTRVTSAGPDRRFDTPDDLWCEVILGAGDRVEMRTSWEKVP